MEKQHPLTDLMGTAMEKIRTMVDANTIIGTPIQTGDVTLIPVSRLSFGIASGGSDFTTKNQKPEADNSFGGGSGASAKLEQESGGAYWTHPNDEVMGIETPSGRGGGPSAVSEYPAHGPWDGHLRRLRHPDGGRERAGPL